MKNFNFFEPLQGVHILLGCFLCSRIFSAVFRRSCMDFSRTIWNFFQSPDLSPEKEHLARGLLGTCPLRLQPQGRGVRALFRAGGAPERSAQTAPLKARPGRASKAEISSSGHLRRATQGPSRHSRPGTLNPPPIRAARRSPKRPTRAWAALTSDPQTPLFCLDESGMPMP